MPRDPGTRDGHARTLAPGGVRRVRRSTLAYDAEIRFVDDQIGRLVGHFDRTFGAGRTLVIVATDHGEGLMQRGWMAHGVHLHEELVRVALVMRWPAHLAPGLRLTAPVGLIDVAPTILALLELPPMPAQGEDLSPALLRYAEIPADRALYFERPPYDGSHRRGWDVSRPMFGIRRGQWKYIQTGDAGALFELETDPREAHDRRDTDVITAEGLAADLRAWRERNRRRRPQPGVR
jgi:arylsulfatase A-like enzyme